MDLDPRMGPTDVLDALEERKFNYGQETGDVPGAGTRAQFEINRTRRTAATAVRFFVIVFFP